MKKNQLLIAGGIVLLTLAVYLFFAKKQYEALHYFLPLSNAMLQGKLYIVGYDQLLNELVNINGRSYVVYPPMPAIALVPFALVFGMKISQVYPGIIYASLAGGIFYLASARLAKPASALWLTLLLIFGTNFFMTALIGRSWFFAHICAVLFLSVSIYFAVAKKPLWAGAFLAMAGLSRLPVFLAAVMILYLLTNANTLPKLHLRDAAWRFGLPVAAGIFLYGIYNIVRFGSFLQTGYSLIPGVLEEPWFARGIFSLTYIPRNLEAIFAYFPRLVGEFPFVVISPMGMAAWLVTPAFLLLIFSAREKLSKVMLAGSALVLLPSLSHGTVGFSQFGYRFLLDATPFLLIGLIPIFDKRPALAKILTGLSVAINLSAVILFHLGYFEL